MGALIPVLCRPPSASAFSPLSLPSLALWLDASDAGTLWQDSSRTTPVAADGDPVGAWDDKSGNGRHVLQATASKRPTYKVGNIGTGKSSVKGDGADDYLSCASVALPRDITIFVVQKRGGVGTTYFFVEHGPNGAIAPGFFFHGGSDGFSAHRGSPHYITPASGTVDGSASTSICEASYDGTNFTLRRNGASIAGTATGSALPTGTVTDTLYVSSRAWTGVISSADLAEIVIYGSALSAADIVRVETYLNAKWAVY